MGVQNMTRKDRGINATVHYIALFAFTLNLLNFEDLES